MEEDLDPTYLALDQDHQEEERWAYLEGYDQLYAISDRGRFWTSYRIPSRPVFRLQLIRVRYGTLRTLTANKDGYYDLSLQKPGGIQKKFLLHRLVALHFIPNPLNLPLVLHRDDVKTNNWFRNLRWGTDKDNAEDRTRNGTHGGGGRRKPKTEWDTSWRRAIRGMYREEVPIKQIARWMGLTPSAVRYIVDTDPRRAPRN